MKTLWVSYPHQGNLKIRVSAGSDTSILGYCNAKTHLALNCHSPFKLYLARVVNSTVLPSGVHFIMQPLPCGKPCMQKTLFLTASPNCKCETLSPTSYTKGPKHSKSCRTVDGQTLHHLIYPKLQEFLKNAKRRVEQGFVLGFVMP